MTFINISNHASEKWDEKQLAEAGRYGSIVDLPFPAISPILTDGELNGLVDDYFAKVLAFDEPTVMLQGEYLFTYRLICRLKSRGIRVVASCSERRSVECRNEQGMTERRSIFEFVCFKEY